MSRLPDGYRTLRLTTEVRQTFEEHLDFSFIDDGNAGVMYGRLSARRELVVDYVAPFFLDPELTQTYDRGYALGRAEALFEAVWQLRGLRPLGYWLAFGGEVPALDQVLARLTMYAGLHLKIDELALLIAARPQVRTTVMAAYTYTAHQPVSAWRSLTCQ
ncbi:hypothetical protein [Deinococcus ruber]|uniref:Uncharacterized protein n=1 Tax=Deinococcus ruber TaxID=1848197 RepID=A0A918KXJ5_9DEIO|nr:hypothetical protein [Deinococcus ruber]GGR40381.1 hypothetical protein GCM10008957_56100 [Deinococcus ruber]